MADMRELIDRVTRGNDEERRRLTSAAAAATAGSNPLNLRFAPGDRVLDQVTGRRGVIDLGTRDPVLRTEIYRVKLEIGGEQLRTRQQLEPDPSPAPGGTR